jgi:hypothetical protein
MAKINEILTITRRNTIKHMCSINHKLFIILMLLIHVNTVCALKCVCNPVECDVIRPDDCPGKGYVVWDPCK